MKFNLNGEHISPSVLDELFGFMGALIAPPVTPVCICRNVIQTIHEEKAKIIEAFLRKHMANPNTSQLAIFQNHGEAEFAPFGDCDEIYAVVPVGETPSLQTVFAQYPYFAYRLIVKTEQ